MVEEIIEKTEVAKLEDGTPIIVASRWGKNGRLYQWDITTQKQLDNLIKKYGIEQIDARHYSIWLCQW